MMETETIEKELKDFLMNEEDSIPINEALDKARKKWQEE